ncbi:MAG TPA: protease complex subunit PrcB family protein [Azospirillaceae bacterium]|nr:protease complex subunit PrcB family protein [Azospirillaceae bacterium]
MRLTIIGLFAATALLAAGCDTLSHYAAGEPLPGTKAALSIDRADSIGNATSWQGDQAARPQPGPVTARTGEEWKALWRDIGREAPGDLPPRAMALAVLLGERPTGGYAVTIEDWSIQPVPGVGRALVVTWREKVPPKDAVVTQALTRPWDIQLVRAVDGPVHFAKAE